MKTPSRTELPDRPPLPTTAPDAGTVEQPADGAPVLAEIADIADARDRLAARLAVRLVTAMDEDLVTTETRLSTQVWLENVVRFTAAEARRLLGIVTVLKDLPATLAGLRDGRLSWPQVQQLCAAAKTITVAQRAELDDLIGGALDEYRRFHPDELCDRVWQVCDGWQPSRLEKMEHAAERDEFVTLSPNFFGGGSLYAELGTVNFATACEALDAPLSPPSVADVDLDDPEQVDLALDDLDQQRRALAREHGSDLAARFVQICEDALAGRTADGQRIAPRPTAYIVTTADALCDADRTPAWLLTTLTGGTLKASTSLIQRLVDERGADVRGIVLDDLGQLVGVGRKHRQPRHWLREALWATWLTDQAPAAPPPSAAATSTTSSPGTTAAPPTPRTSNRPAVAPTPARPTGNGTSTAPATAPPPGPTATPACTSPAHPPGAPSAPTHPTPAPHACPSTSSTNPTTHPTTAPSPPPPDNHSHRTDPVSPAPLAGSPVRRGATSAEAGRRRVVA